MSYEQQSFRDLNALSPTFGISHLAFASINAFVMKVVVAGATGRIGSEVLSQLVQNKDITSIIVLSRRPLEGAATRDPRIRVIVLKSFLEYEDEVVKELVGARAVFWALGGSNVNPTPSDRIDEVEVQYPLALANVFTRARRPGQEKDKSEAKLRFLFISGTLSERDQSKRLWFMDQGRKARGLAETRLFEIAQQNPNSFEAVVIKAAYVVPKESKIPDMVVGCSRNAIRVNELAAAMVDCALDRHGSETVGNSELRSLGRKLLKI